VRRKSRVAETKKEPPERAAGRGSAHRDLRGKEAPPPTGARGFRVAAVVAVAVVAAALAQTGRHGNTTGKIVGARQANALFSGIPQDGVTLGRPSAPVAMVEFADLQCPFCRDYSLDALPALVKDYVATGKVKMEFRDISIIGPDSTAAARAAGAAALQDKLWQFADLFYRN
jgi:protein-disulfide isomerase